jgi:(E)-4-hydroxy-3-methylbut-2-enyl-diphosphate synthase
MIKRVVFIGKVGIGGDYPISIQSMTNTDTHHIQSTLRQIKTLSVKGCDIVRLALPDKSAVEPFARIIKKSPLPVIADIHFDAYLAMQAIDKGAHGLRINPGNIGSRQKIKQILDLAIQKKIPIRIGINAGSMEKKRKNKQSSKAELMVASALDAIKFFEDCGFFDIKISLKSSSVTDTIAAYRLINQKCPYPLHVGITEAGTFFSGIIKSAVGIGSLLAMGIGNTIRVSLTEQPAKEIDTAIEILHALGLRKKRIEIISCPTCSRTSVNLISIVKQIEKDLQKFKPTQPVKIAVMGCEVNGPGEATDADIGIAFSRQKAYLFMQGKLIESGLQNDMIESLKIWIKKNYC